jgi:hypothetical protein
LFARSDFGLIKQKPEKGEVSSKLHALLMSAMLFCSFQAVASMIERELKIEYIVER